MRVKLIKRGNQIHTMTRLVELILERKEFVYFGDKPLHPRFLGHWSLDIMYQALQAGRFFRALPNKDHILFEVWSEGYVATGEHALAYKEGEVWAASFQEACDKAMKGRSTYNSEKLSDWGCRLFDNEADAREFCG